MSLRLFVGIRLSAHITATVLSASESLRTTDFGWRDAKWVPVENLHVTVAFLGSVEPSIVPALSKSLSTIVSASPPVRLTLQDVQPLPDSSRCRMVWVTFTDEGSVLGRLAETIRDGARCLGVGVDAKPFRAHATICRTRKPQSISLSGLSAMKRLVQSQPHSMSDPAITLFSSRLAPGGPHYSEIATWVSTGE